MPKYKEQEERVHLLIRRMILRDNGLAGIALWIPWKVTSQVDSLGCAWTNGDSIHLNYVPDNPPLNFFALEEKQQLAVLVHEILHIAFRHVPRAKKFSRNVVGDSEMNWLLWNIACDCLVNDQVSKAGWCSLPPGGVRIEGYLPYEVLQKSPAVSWSVEALYQELQKHVVTITIPVGGIGKDLDYSGSRSKGSGDNEEQRRDKQGACNEEDFSPQTEESKARAWANRLIRARAGSSPGSMLRNIDADIPVPRVDWIKLTREFMITSLLPFTESSWRRPSRRSLAGGDSYPYITPGITRKRGVSKMGVIIDTSGSIDKETLSKFISLSNSVIEQTGAELILMQCDAEVSAPVLRTVNRIPVNLEIKGGGGTDFRPALMAMEKYKPDCCIYFTDLMGTFPDKPPSYPLLWLTTMDGNVPFGRKVLIGKE